MKHISTEKNSVRINQYIVIIIATLVVMCLMAVITKGEYFRLKSMKAVLMHMVVPSCVACALSFLFTAGIDLSLGAVMSLSGFMAAALADHFGLGYLGLILGSIGVSVILLSLNAVCMNILKIPSWAGSLGLALFYEAIGVYYNRYMMDHGGAMYYLSKRALELGKFPWILLAAFIVFLAAYIVYYHTRIGLNLRACSGNAEVSRMLGINVTKTFVLGFIAGAVFLGLASAINVSYSRTLSASSGLGSISALFKPMAILFMGMALEKYMNRIIGIVLSGFLIMSLFNVMTQLGVPSGTFQNVALGACIILLGIFAQRGSKGVVK